MVTLLNDENIEKYLEESNQKPLIIDAYAEWCGPCQQMTPIFQEIAKELADKYTFLKLDVDENPDLAARFKVRSVPTIVFVKNGEVRGVRVGFMNKNALKTEIEKAFQAKAF
jgi:thioredoxin 1